MIHCLIFCIVLCLTVFNNKTADWGGCGWWCYYLPSLVCLFLTRLGFNQGCLRYRPYIAQTWRVTVDSNFSFADLGPRWADKESLYSHCIVHKEYEVQWNDFKKITVLTYCWFFYRAGCDVLRLVLGDGKIVSCIDHRYCWLPSCYYWAEIIKYKPDKVWKKVLPYLQFVVQSGSLENLSVLFCTVAYCCVQCCKLFIGSQFRTL